MSLATRLAIQWTERGLMPDALIRGGIRHLVRQRLGEISAFDCERMADETNAFIEAMNESVVAPLPEKANEQHYEVPPEFYELVLGTFDLTHSGASLPFASVCHRHRLRWSRP